MGEALILDTSFLIDLEREQRRGRAARAIEYLEQHEDARLYITFTSRGRSPETRHGGPPRNRVSGESLCEPGTSLAIENVISQ
jgi:hypothetical protein